MNHWPGYRTGIDSGSSSAHTCNFRIDITKIPASPSGTCQGSRFFKSSRRFAIEAILQRDYCWPILSSSYHAADSPRSTFSYHTLWPFRACVHVILTSPEPRSRAAKATGSTSVMYKPTASGVLPLIPVYQSLQVHFWFIRSIYFTVLLDFRVFPRWK